jgi:phosphatidylcholine synthase
MSPIATAVLVLTCVGLTFVPLKWAHPLRTPGLWHVTLAASALWLLAAAHTLWLGFPARTASAVILLATAAYGVGLTLSRGRRR